MSVELLKTNKDWLIWARTSIKYEKEEVADKLNVNPQQITEWERTGKLTYDDLMALSELYNVSPYTFFDSNTPKHEKEIVDFRTINNKLTNSHKIMLELRAAKQKRNFILGIEDEDLNFNNPEFKFKNTEIVLEKDIISLIINELKMNTAKRGNYSLEHWIKSIEKLGVLIFQFYNIDPDDLRGYALYYDKLPIIGINHKENENARKFTLFHELAHLIIKQEGLSNLNSYEIENKIEVKCNNIAGEVLVPSNYILNMVGDKSVDEIMNDSFINILSNNMKVSKEVIVRKYLNNNLITSDDYNKYKSQLTKYLNNKTPKSKYNKKKTNYIASEKNKLKYKEKIASQLITQNGEYYINSLIYAYKNELITDLDFSRELGTSLMVVNIIIQKIYERSQ